MKKNLVLSLFVASTGLGVSRAATVAISSFNGGLNLNNVIATASSEYPGGTFSIANAFDNNASTAWAANGNGTGSPGNLNPDATMTIDLNFATLNGNGGSFFINTFSFTERSSSTRDRVGTWQVELFLDGSLVATSGSQSGPGSAGAVGSFNFGGVIADEVRYTALTRGDEGTTGNTGATQFNLTGALVPEPSATLLGGLGLVCLLLRRNRG